MRRPRTLTMSIPKPAEQLRYFRKQQSQIVETIRQLVEIESPSDVKQAVDRLGAVLASRFAELGGRVRFHAAEKFGNHLQVDFKSAHRRHEPALLLGHLDTVYSVGTISKMPCRVAKGRVWGPGVLDMKSGIALALHVMEALLKWGLSRPVSMLLVSDEEVGSKASRGITLNVGRVSGGTRVNVVPAEATALLDLRVATVRDGVRIERKLLGLKPFNRKYKVEVSGGFNRPP